MFNYKVLQWGKKNAYLLKALNFSFQDIIPVQKE